MKIMFVCDVFQWGGIETCVMELIKCFQDKQYQIAIVSLSYDKKNSKIQKNVISSVCEKK